MKIIGYWTPVENPALPRAFWLTDFNGNKIAQAWWNKKWKHRCSTPRGYIGFYFRYSVYAKIDGYIWYGTSSGPQMRVHLKRRKYAIHESGSRSRLQSVSV